jgi:hypothetical protein
MHACSDTDLRKCDLPKFFSVFLVFQCGASIVPPLNNLVFIITLELVLLYFTGLSETVRGSNCYFSWLFYYSVLPFVSL